MRTGFLTLLAVLLSGLPVSAQVEVPTAVCADAPGGAVIRGQVVSQRVDGARPTSGVLRQEFTADRRACGVRIDSAGSFEVTGVAPGQYSLRVAGARSGGVAGVVLLVGDAPIAAVTIDLDRPNALLACLEVQVCWPMLRDPWPTLDGTDPASLERTGLRLAAAMGLASYVRPDALCVEGDAAAIQALRVFHPEVHPRSECLPPSDARFFPLPLDGTSAVPIVAPSTPFTHAERRAVVISTRMLSRSPATEPRISITVLTQLNGGRTFECRVDPRQGAGQGPTCWVTFDI